MTDIENKIEEKHIEIDEILDKIKEYMDEQGLFFEYEYNYIPKCELCEDLKGYEEYDDCMNSIDLFYTFKYAPTAKWMHDEDRLYTCCQTALRGIVMSAELMVGMKDSELSLVDYDDLNYEVDEENGLVYNNVFFVFN